MTLKKNQDQHNNNKTQILIVDDHPVVRDGLTTIINHEPDMNVCGEADSACQALKAVTELKPDVIVVDISLKNSDGIDLTKSVTAVHPKLSVIVLSVHDESVYAERALLAGAQGVSDEGCCSENIIKAIRTVLSSEIYVSNTISKKFLHQIAKDKAGTTQTPILSIAHIFC